MAYIVHVTQKLSTTIFYACSHQDWNRLFHGRIFKWQAYHALLNSLWHFHSYCHHLCWKKWISKSMLCYFQKKKKPGAMLLCLNFYQLMVRGKTNTYIYTCIYIHTLFGKQFQETRCVPTANLPGLKVDPLILVINIVASVQTKHQLYVWFWTFYLAAIAPL